MVEQSKKDILIRELESKLIIKDDEVNSLKRRIDALKQEIQELGEAEGKIKQLATILAGCRQKLLAHGEYISPDDEVAIREAEGILAKLSSLPEQFNACDFVANWLALYQEKLLDGQIKRLQKNRPGILHDESSRDLFKEDLRKLLVWVQGSLEYGHYLPIQELRESLNKSWLFLYKQALKSLKNDECADLSPEQQKYYSMFIQKLMDTIAF
ncbi:MAG: hypothetical protein AAFY41_12670 [Bacteroidota bacterium]